MDISSQEEMQEVQDAKAVQKQNAEHAKARKPLTPRLQYVSLDPPILCPVWEMDITSKQRQATQVASREAQRGEKSPRKS